MTETTPAREIPSGCFASVVIWFWFQQSIGLSRVGLNAGVDWGVCRCRGGVGGNLYNGFDRGEFNGVRDLRCFDDGPRFAIRRVRGGKRCFINLCLCDEPDIIPDAYRRFLTCGIINAGNIVYAVGIIFIAGLVSIAYSGVPDLLPSARVKPLSYLPEGTESNT